MVSELRSPEPCTGLIVVHGGTVVLLTGAKPSVATTCVREVCRSMVVLKQVKCAQRREEKGEEKGVSTMQGAPARCGDTLAWSHDCYGPYQGRRA